MTPDVLCSVLGIVPALFDNERAGKLRLLGEFMPQLCREAVRSSARKLSRALRKDSCLNRNEELGSPSQRRLPASPFPGGTCARPLLRDENREFICLFIVAPPLGC